MITLDDQMRSFFWLTHLALLDITNLSQRESFAPLMLIWHVHKRRQQQQNQQQDIS